MTTRTQTLFLAWIGFCIMVQIDLQTIHLTHGVDMIELANEQLNLTIKFATVFAVLTVTSYIFDFTK